MKNGLYKVEFQTPLGAGAGVAILTDGAIRGGDSAMYYAGSYQLEGGKFTAKVLSARHSAGAQSVFGKDRVNIQLSGTATDDSAQCRGTASEAPGISFQAVLKRISD